MNQAAPLTYNVNRDGAIRASGTPRITHKGAFIGTFTRAEHTVSRRGTVGIDFSFVSEDGASADYLTVWTQKGDGEELSGRALLDAIMTCMAVRALEPKRGRIEKYNPDTREREQTDAVLYPELMDKRIGLLLIVEEYIGNDGGKRSKMMIQGAFEPVSQKTAKEIWNKEPAKALPSLIAGLRDRLLAPGAVASRPASAAPDYGYTEADDIPF
jgi:hypothetical protein